MKKVLLLILTLFATNVVFAQEFTENGINYKVTSPTTVEVGLNPGFRGGAVIPSSVNYASVVYNVTAIGERAFWQCTGLTSVNIPNSIIYIGIGAFANCFGLTSLTIGNKVEVIDDNAFSSCYGLTSLNIPNSVNEIGSSTFLNCYGLTYLSIPSSVTSIGFGAFQNCLALTSLIIPNSITRFKDFAFAGCTSLKSVKVSWSTPLSLNISLNAFLSVAIVECILFVPAGTLNAYKAAAVWQDFGTIIETTLPLTLTSLTAKAISTGNQVNWSTADIVNVKNITLERSGADNNFSPLVVLPTSAVQYIDINPLPGDNYYRLSSTDNDGTTQTYPLIAFVKGLSNEVSYYPNPITNGVLNVVAGSYKIESVALFDLNGKKVVFVNAKSNSQNLAIPTQGLAKGVYVLEIKGEKTSTTKKVVVE